MRIPAVTTVILGLAASVATAAPARDETTGRVSYSAPAASEAGWTELASATPASHGREFIVVGADAGSLTHLRVAAASGRPAIQAVRVDYIRGGHRTFAVGKSLTARRPAVLDLRGPREIAQIVVLADAGSRGSYTLSARTGATGVAMR
jgi:hypothetical protein